jgi:hypothetical protein
MLTATKAQSTISASAILPLVLVFLCGVSVGALVMSLGLHKMMHSGGVSVSSKAQNAMTLDRWKRELNLNPQQVTQIQQILDDFSKYYDNVLADGNTRIMQILDEKQQTQFQQMLKDRR